MGSFADPALAVLILSACHLWPQSQGLGLSRQPESLLSFIHPPQQAALPCMGFWAAWPSLPGALRPVPGLWLRVFTPVFVQGGREGRGRCWGNWNSAGHRAGWARWPGRAKGLQGEAIKWGMFIVAGQESHASHSPRACNGVGQVPVS